MGKHWDDQKMDAFGHLNWTVGNEDWMACFDAIRVGDRIHYEVVVDCDSGGFTDTLEKSDVPATAEGVANLKRMPDYWADMCYEQYINERGPKGGELPRYRVSAKATTRTRKSWAAHLDDLVGVGR